MTTDPITWEDPPLSNRGRCSSPWPARTAALAELPGQWAKFGPYRTKSATGTTVLTKRYPGYEFTTRTIDGVIWLFARKVAE